MSFLFSHTSKNSQTSFAPQVQRHVELPKFDHPDEVRVLPYDKAVSDVAETALRFAGADILKTQFGVHDSFVARSRIQAVASKVTDLGVEAAHRHNPLFDQVNVAPDDILKKTSYGFATLKEEKTAPMKRRGPMGPKLEPVKVLPDGVNSESELVPKQIEELWQDKALQGEDASLVLLSLSKLANTPEQGFAADRAAELIGNIHPDDTRIALK